MNRHPKLNRSGSVPQAGVVNLQSALCRSIDTIRAMTLERKIINEDRIFGDYKGSSRIDRGHLRKNRSIASSNLLTPRRLTVFVCSGDLRLWFGCDGNLNVSTLFEPHIIAIFVS